MFAELTVADGDCETVEEAIEKSQMRQAQNNLDMVKLLKELHIDPSTIQRSTFVHLPLQLAKRVWEHLLAVFACDTAKKYFIDRIWVWNDVGLCAHG
jgi:hypothetical protein